MSSRRVSGSIFWGLVFLAIGCMFLARNMGYPISMWNIVVRYWPVVLIAWGLFKLVDYVRMQEGTGKRSVFSGGDVALIVLVILFGSFMTLAANMNPDWSKFIQTGDFDVWDLTGNNFVFTEHHEMDALPDSVIEISNRNGEVDVMPADVDRISVDVSKTIHAENQAQATGMSTSFVYSITKEDSKYRIGSNFDHRAKASLTIHVPKRSIVSVENRNGSVRIKSLTGNQNVANRFGEVDIRGIVGTVKVDSPNGAVHVEDVSDSVTISSSFAPITVANVRGNLNIQGRNNAVDIDHVEKDLNVESSFQNMDIRDPRGAVSVKNRNGEVSIQLKQAPTKDISLTSEFGGLTIELPAASSFNADVHSRFGDVYSDFTELHTQSHNADHSMDGHVGSGGPNIRVDSRNGEVRFRKRG